MKFENFKKGLLGVMAIGSTAAMAQGGEKQADKEFLKTNIGTARKVTKIPAGYTIVHTEGNKTYGMKTIDGKNGGVLETANPDGPKGGKKYEEWIIHMLKNGITTPEKLVEGKYISPDAVDKFRPYYKAPASDIVYTEKDELIETDPYARFATRGEIIYGPDNHAAAEIFYPIRDSHSATDAGMLNTQKTEALIRFRNDKGWTGETIVLPASEFGQIFAGTNHFQSQAKLDDLKNLASLSSSKNKTYTLRSEDIERGSTLRD